MSVRLFAAVALLAFAAPGAQASPYDAEYVFGDSLSDNGNLAEVYYQQNFPNPPSFHDTFSNGPAAVSVLANTLGVPLNPSLWVTGFSDVHNLFGGPSFTPGTNYAVAGATAALQAQGGPTGINLPQQIAAYSALAHGTADPNALYVVMIGGNDVRNATLQGSGTAAVTAGVQAELTAVEALSAEGARHLLVVNVPNVGVIPEFALYDPSQAATATTYSQQYDQLLASGLAGLPLSAGTSLTQFDLYDFNNGLLANAAAYGLTDTIDPCFTTTPLSSATTAACGPNGANINSFVYWDAIHPTAVVQNLWGVGLENAVGVPEPSTIALLSVGVVGVLARRRSAV